MSVKPGASAESRIVDALDTDEVVGLLDELVAIGSVDGTPDEIDVQHWSADALSGHGFTVDAWSDRVDDLILHPEFPGMEVTREEIRGCVGVLGPPDSSSDEVPALALYAHTDVVPIGNPDEWVSDPFDMVIDDDGRCWGRGTCDMKGGLAAILGAVAALKRSGVELRRPLAVHTVSGEEDGGSGAFATLLRGHTAEACVSTEPTSGTIIPTNAGSLTFTLQVAGLATHGSTRTHGVSAIEKFEIVHRALRDLEATRNADIPDVFSHLDLAWPISIGKIEAGDWASSVPDLLTAEGRYGVRIDESVAEAQLAMSNAIERATKQDPWLAVHAVTLDWTGGMFAPGTLPEGSALLPTTQAAIAATVGSEAGVYGGPYGSDLRLYNGAGIPMLQYGPGSVEYAHSSEEHVSIDDLARCAEAYARMIARLCC